MKRRGLLLLSLLLLLSAGRPLPAGTPPITAIDTMKESRDSDTRPLSDAQIRDDIATSALLHPAYITVDTFYDYPVYMARWVRAVRAAHKRVWFRCCFNAWEGNNGVPATMTPPQYTQALQSFLAGHPDLFQPGDILDPLPEPENGKYWVRTSAQGKDWSWKDAPNATTDEFNRFFVGLSQAADLTLTAHGVRGVLTHIRSTNGWIAARPATLYPATVAALGCITTDSYVGQSPTVTPADALRALQAEITGIERIRRVPLVIGEFGYSIQGLVDDRQQQAVLRPQLAWLRTLPYLRGVNYWHGAGYPAPDTYNGSRLFTGTVGAWTLRPAAHDLAEFYQGFGRPLPRRPLPRRQAACPSPEGEGSLSREVNEWDKGFLCARLVSQSVCPIRSLSVRGFPSLQGRDRRLAAEGEAANSRTWREPDRTSLAEDSGVIMRAGFPRADELSDITSLGLSRRVVGSGLGAASRRCRYSGRCPARRGAR